MYSFIFLHKILVCRGFNPSTSFRFPMKSPPPGGVKKSDHIRPKDQVNPWLLEKPFSSLWMTLEGTFNQKEGARTMTIGIIVFLITFSWQWHWPYSNMKRMVVQQESLKVKNELTFPFVDTTLCTVTSHLFRSKSSSLFELFSLPRKYISVLDIILKVWTMMILLHIYIDIYISISCKFNDSRNSFMKWCDLESLRNNVSFRYTTDRLSSRKLAILVEGLMRAQYAAGS
jgi:hypothetical protein